jgi:uncharacterized protein YjiK
LADTQRLFAAPGTEPSAITWDGTSYWVGDARGTIFRLDIDGKVIDTMAAPPAGGGFRQGGLTWTGGTAFAVYDGAGALGIPSIYNFVVTGSSTQPTGSFGAPAADWTQDNYMTWDGAALWYANGFKAHQLTLTGEELAQFSSGQPIRGIAWDGAHFWLTHPSVGTQPETVQQVSTTGAVLKTLATNADFMDALTWVNGSLLVLAGSGASGYAIYKLDVGGSS